MGGGSRELAVETRSDAGGASAHRGPLLQRLQRRPLGGLRGLLARGARVVGAARPGLTPEEVNAAACLEMFLCASVGRRKASSLGTALFALGALDAAASRSRLAPEARERLEARFIETFFGAGRRQAEGWRTALREFERTRQGRVLRSWGEAALRAWLRGESPSPYLSRVLAS